MWKLAIPLMLLGTGCATVAEQSAICDGTKAMRDDHTAALLADGGDLSVQTGAKLIGAVDAACRD